jgi:hypothetical protein
MKYKFYSWINDLWYLNLRVFASIALFYGALILSIFKIPNLSRKLCAMSLRYGVRRHAVVLYKKILDKYPYSSDDVSSGVSISEAALRSIVVKWPSYNEDTIEKGVVIVTFTKTFSYYIRSINFSEMQKHFWIVFEPSWSGYADPDIFFFYRRYAGLIISCSEIEDRILLNCFKETFIPVTFGASDWVDHRRFSPSSVNKTYDSIYIANTKPIKRVKRYLDAIHNIVNNGMTEYKGLLVCASWGGGEQLVKNLVSQYGLQDNIELKFSLNTKDLIDCLCMSKVNVLLSYKEGSNRSLFEAIFCDVPVICLSENIGVNKSYINESTGILIPDLFLEQSLEWLAKNSECFNPRSWAIKNISPEASTSKLAHLLCVQPESMLVKTNNPEVSYFDHPDIDHSKYMRNVLELFGSDDDKPLRVYRDRILEIKNDFQVASSV